MAIYQYTFLNTLTAKILNWIEIAEVKITVPPLSQNKIEKTAIVHA